MGVTVERISEGDGKASELLRVEYNRAHNRYLPSHPLACHNRLSQRRTASLSCVRDVSAVVEITLLAWNIRQSQDSLRWNID